MSFRGLVVVLVLLAAGCGGGDHPPVYPVSGTVTYNGEPVAGAEVVFLPQAESAAQAPRGVTDAQGRYQLSTYFSTETDVRGAPPGAYKVTVTKLEMPPGIIDPYKTDTPQPKHLLPETYMSSQQTPFTATVEAKTNNFPWALKD